MALSHGDKIIKAKGIEQCGWGGMREGAGRPPKDTKQMTCRMPPVAIGKLKKLAEEKDKTIGEYICEQLNLI